LLVACRRNASEASSSFMPAPSSAIWMSVFPPSFTVTEIDLDFASIEFSSSSFTTDSGRWTTSPAAILLANDVGSIVIVADKMLRPIFFEFFVYAETRLIVQPEHSVDVPDPVEGIVADQDVPVEIRIVDER